MCDIRNNRVFHIPILLAALLFCKQSCPAVNVGGFHCNKSVHSIKVRQELLQPRLYIFSDTAVLVYLLHDVNQTIILDPSSNMEIQFS